MGTYTHTGESLALTGIQSHTVNTSKTLWLAYAPELELPLFLPLLLCSHDGAECFSTVSFIGTVWRRAHISGVVIFYC